MGKLSKEFICGLMIMFIIGAVIGGLVVGARYQNTIKPSGTPAVDTTANSKSDATSKSGG